jgi:hypothetical protein
VSFAALLVVAVGGLAGNGAIGWGIHPFVAVAISLALTVAVVRWWRGMTRQVRAYAATATVVIGVGAGLGFPLHKIKGFDDRDAGAQKAHARKQAELDRVAADAQWKASEAARARDRAQVPMLATQIDKLLADGDWCGALTVFRKARDLDSSYPALAREREVLMAHGLVDAASQRTALVDQDCYADGLVCDKGRVWDAEALAGLLAVSLEPGELRGCFEVSYITGDDKTPASAIVVSMKGCDSRVGRATLQKLAGQTKKALKTKPVLACGVDTIMFTDGWGVQIQVTPR